MLQLQSWWGDSTMLMLQIIMQHFITCLLELHDLWTKPTCDTEGVGVPCYGYLLNWVWDLILLITSQHITFTILHTKHYTVKKPYFRTAIFSYHLYFRTLYFHTLGLRTKIKLSGMGSFFAVDTNIRAKTYIIYDICYKFSCFNCVIGK